MRSGNDAYMLQGIILATPESPGVGTPVFKKVHGKSLYIQEFDGGRNEVISGFYRISQCPAELLSSFRPNLGLHVGDKVQYGARLVSGRVLVGDREELTNLCSLVDDHELSPFLKYQLSFVSNDASFLVRALQEKCVVEALVLREIDLPPFVRRGNGWSDAKVEALVALWKQGTSAEQIGSLLGLSRYAVIGKVHRLGLYSPPLEPASLPATEEGEAPPNRKGWWSLGT